MKDPKPSPQVHLPADRAFVVQFTAGPVAAAGGRGRVEHLASGEAIRFESLAHLEEFFARVLSGAPGAHADGGSPRRGS